MNRRTSMDRFMPVAYFAIAATLVAMLLPTALRPPPQQPPTSAELNPDVPPEDNEILLTELAQGKSATAGAGETPVGDLGPGVPGPGIDLKPRKGRCFGDPARQTLSIYSAPCAAAWSGNNGGATYYGVGPNEVRIAMWHILWPTSYEGAVPWDPPQTENENDRFYRVFQKYFNERFELYGRTLRFYSGNETSSNFAAQRAEGVKAIQEWKVFAGNIIGEPACDEFTRRKLPCFGGQYPEYYYAEKAPYMWSWYMQTTQLRTLLAEYVCKKLWGKNAAHAGDPTLQNQPRKIAMIYPDYHPWHTTADELDALLRKQCGAKLDDRMGYNWGNGDQSNAAGQQQLATAMARFKANGITTVIPGSEFVTALTAQSQANSVGYFPEWVVYGGALEHNQTGKVMLPNQWKNAFGISGYEMPRVESETDCFKAYREIDPDNNPDPDLCRWMYPSLLQIANGIQMAGPNLTPQTFQQGLFKMGHRFYPQIWAIGGGFGPGDYSYMDNVAEIWWDPAGRDPYDGSVGAYRYVRGGKRYKIGEFEREDPRVFRDCITEAPPDPPDSS